jgi:hypothetical protein
MLYAMMTMMMVWIERREAVRDDAVDYSLNAITSVCRMDGLLDNYSRLYPSFQLIFPNLNSKIPNSNLASF